MHLVHNLVRPGSASVNIATIFGEDFDIEFPVDGLFNSHIAIFGNTGSGKSNTLACLYQELVQVLRERNVEAFNNNARFVLFDFNGEYADTTCITGEKTVYNLSTRNDDGDRLPMQEDGLLEMRGHAVLRGNSQKWCRSLRLRIEKERAH